MEASLAPTLDDGSKEDLHIIASFCVYGLAFQALGHKKKNHANFAVIACKNSPDYSFFFFFQIFSLVISFKVFPFFFSLYRTNLM